ncbi:Frog skin active peptide family signal and propeptide [Lishizhenia tianjinensis]|uniref:Skin active peptide family signal and propeptide n=1 Tax=Lishizhenia tianjinensis TaxID=477690 RepID=A0A1I7BP29_9FLAO|nr:cation transporter [Lishizhenia tianjinensis]SFT88960.1 Frog skin active peptide family signal and propeptide [Lishizhenia tianjinensis]
MKPFTLIALLGIVSLSACNNEANTEEITSEHNEVVRQEQAHDPASVDANASVNLEVEGMMCVMGCGSEIRKHLYATRAVKSVSFDFLEGRKKNTATIHYNANAITADKLIETIEDIESSDFNANLQEEKEEAKDKAENFENDEDASLINVKTKNISLPNLTEILHHLFF